MHRVGLIKKIWLLTLFLLLGGVQFVCAQPSQGGKMIVIPEGQSPAEVFPVLNLVKIGEGRFSDLSEETSTPLCAYQIYRKHTELIEWRWKTSDTLVGTAVERTPPDYELDDYLYNSDMPIVDVYLFLYSISQDKIYYLNTPKPRKDYILQLEGVTGNGELLLLEIDDRAGGNPNVLGLFDLSQESQAEISK